MSPPLSTAIQQADAASVAAHAALDEARVTLRHAIDRFDEAESAYDAVPLDDDEGLLDAAHDYDRADAELRRASCQHQMALADSVLASGMLVAAIALEVAAIRTTLSGGRA